jgi:AcrR family transcriptional regulator
VAEATATTTDPKARLLDSAMEYVAAHGVGDLSLRAIAAAIGTSHRMLIYHFGSKEGLLIAVIQAVEQEQRDQLAAFKIDATMTPAQITRQMWKHLSNPRLWPNERLFYEMYGQALQGRPHTAGFLDDIVTAWLEPIAAVRRAQGVPAKTAEAQARLDLAVTRGLLLDLLATRDRKGVDAALEQAIALYDAWHDVMPS